MLKKNQRWKSKTLIGDKPNCNNFLLFILTFLSEKEIATITKAENLLKSRAGEVNKAIKENF